MWYAKKIVFRLFNFYRSSSNGSLLEASNVATEINGYGYNVLNL